jgi:hypothetical protein
MDIGITSVLEFSIFTIHTATEYGLPLHCNFSPVKLIIHPPLIATEIIPVILVSKICPE